MPAFCCQRHDEDGKQTGICPRELPPLCYTPGLPALLTLVYTLVATTWLVRLAARTATAAGPCPAAQSNKKEKRTLLLGGAHRFALVGPVGPPPHPAPTLSTPPCTMQPPALPLQARRRFSCLLSSELRRLAPHPMNAPKPPMKPPPMPPSMPSESGVLTTNISPLGPMTCDAQAGDVRALGSVGEARQKTRPVRTAASLEQYLLPASSAATQLLSAHIT